MTMKQLVQQFPNQLLEAIKIGESAKIKKHSGIRNVVIAGLGGSGIGGTIVSELVFGQTNCPITVCKGYKLPGFVNQNSLVIASSYSGNTEETLNTLKEAVRKKARVVCITSGGEVAEIAKKKKLELILIPGGNPPRACLAYSLTQLLFILNAKGVIGASFKRDLLNSVTLIQNEQLDISKEAQQLASYIQGKTPIVYATTPYEGVAIRFRQQLNENSKILCGHHVIPEMNHNELVGWPSGSDKVAVIFLRDPNEFERNNARIEINKSVISKYTRNIYEVWAKGKSHIEKAMYLIHLVDWVSVLLAEIKGVDATEVKVIDHLKGELSKM